MKTGKLDKNILRKRVGFVYIIVIDKIIKKIGGSKEKVE